MLLSLQEQHQRTKSLELQGTRLGARVLCKSCDGAVVSSSTPQQRTSGSAEPQAAVGVVTGTLLFKTVSDQESGDNSKGIWESAVVLCTSSNYVLWSPELPCVSTQDDFLVSTHMSSMTMLHFMV